MTHKHYKALSEEEVREFLEKFPGLQDWVLFDENGKETKWHIPVIAYFDSLLSQQSKAYREKVLKVLTDEIATAHTTLAGGKTSRLNSAYNRIDAIFNQDEKCIHEPRFVHDSEEGTKCFCEKCGVEMTNQE